MTFDECDEFVEKMRAESLAISHEALATAHACMLWNHEMVLDELEELRAQVKRLRGLLSSIEWSGSDGHCPYCGGGVRVCDEAARRRGQ